MRHAKQAFCALVMLALSFGWMGTTCNPMGEERAPTETGPYQGDRILRDFERAVTKYSNVIDRLEEWGQLNASLVARNENLQRFFEDLSENRDEHIVAAAEARDAYVAARGAGTLATLEEKLQFVENLIAQAEGIMLSGIQPAPETSSLHQPQSPWRLNPGYL